jgi:nucleoporin NUP159
MVLNNDGVLASWWIVYSDSIRQGTTYPGLVVAEGAQPSAPLAQAAASTFGSPPKPFGAPSIPAPTSKSAFGAPSGLGMRQSPWATSSTAAPTGASTFGTPAFGTPSAPSINKPAFGAPSFGAPSTPAFGSTGFSVPKSSPWGSAATSASTTFGQTTVLGKPGGVFGSAAPVVGAAAPSTGGFASFASKGGFAAAAATPSSGSIFGARPSTGVFGAPSTSSGMGTTSVFGGTKGLEEKAGGPFGSHANNIVIGSTFKADQTAKDERTDASNEPNRPFFGETFGNALGEAAKPPLTENVESKDADMDSTEDISKLEEPVKPSSPTPSSRTAPATSSFFPSAPLDTGGLFGRTSIPPSSAATKSVGSPGFGFGRPAEESKSETFGFSGMNVSSPTPPTAPVEAVVEEKQPSPKVKKEPVTDGEPRPFQRDIDEPPLPPDPTSKTSYAAGDTSVSSTGTEPPLPPDFLPKPATQKPVPANLIPPSYVPGGPDDEEEETEFLSDENDGDESEGPDEEEGEEEEEEGEEEEEEEEEEEGSGEDVAKDLSPASEANETTGFTPQSSFGGLSNRNPESNLFTKIQKPHQLHQPRTLFGELDRAAPVLPPPKLPASPRSPSPVRSALPGRMLRHESSRSVSAPGIASQILGSQRLSQQPAATTQSTFTLSLEQQKAAEKRRAEAKASKEAAEKQALVDNEDEDLQRFLASEPTGTTTLDEFVAHSNYIGPPSMDSIPSQVETVYRDINSMIDTLGLNARTLKCFIKGHTEQRKEGGRTREDLEGDEEWYLVEIEDLSENVESTLMRELESSRVRDVANKLEACSELQRDLIRLRARHEDIKKIHASRLDPSHVATARAQPLSAEQAAQQHDLRRDFLKFQSLLSEAEEGLTVLKAKIVSQATSHGKSSTGTGPTVEAVMRTITKMTSMAEKRSGDIDVLEGQMRKLRFNSAASTGSREGSPFATPQNNRTSLRNPSTSSTYGLFYTPDSIRENQRGFQDSLVSSTGSFTRNSPPRKKLSGYTPEEKNQLRTKLARKKMVTDRLRAALQNAGTNVRLMDDDDEKLWG